ncbi:MAG: hypothetical protein M1500_00805 [Candidatus Marsarchaeota archaeon]|jgi:small subunit ribosomal protein S3Ae|nr:hypothetical protein [Candidatus Marsarchaeota archaeon]MCL5112242.1 hypothetical protein [Candidatus Marsarchaeota archaeon]
MALERKVDKFKLKKWYNVYAPKVFDSAIIGEMPGNDEKAVMGRSIVVGMDSLTHNTSKMNTNVRLKVTEVSGNAAHTNVVRIETLYSYLRSLIRRHRSLVNAIIPAKSSDGSPLVLKMLVVTKRRVARSKISGMRKEVTEFASAYCKENTKDGIVSSIVSGALQAEVSSKLKHITDISSVEVNKLEIKG